MINCDVVLMAREIQSQNWCKAKSDKEEEEKNKDEEVLERAEAAYQKHISGKTLKNADFKDLVEFVVRLEGRKTGERKETHSQHCKTAADMWKRLNNCDEPWTSYFERRADSHAEMEDVQSSDLEGEDIAADPRLEAGAAPPTQSPHLITVYEDGPLGMFIAPDMQTKEIKVIEVKPESLAEIYGIQVGK